MPDKKKKGRKAKDGQLVVRIDKGDRDAFITLCEDLDTSAAREIRRFIREFMALHALREAPKQAAPTDPGGD